jgi:hypothetical protein
MLCSSKLLVHTQPVKVMRKLVSSMLRYRLMPVLKDTGKSLSSQPESNPREV